MAPSAPTAVTISAATHASFRPDGQVHSSSSPFQHSASAEINGNGRTGTAMQAHRSDLNCVGMWATEEECQRTGTPMDTGSAGLPKCSLGGTDIVQSSSMHPKRIVHAIATYKQRVLPPLITSMLSKFSESRTLPIALIISSRERSMNR
jgi:hypothetical protein